MAESQAREHESLRTVGVKRLVRSLLAAGIAIVGPDVAGCANRSGPMHVILGGDGVDDRVLPKDDRRVKHHGYLIVALVDNGTFRFSQTVVGVSSDREPYVEGAVSVGGPLFWLPTATSASLLYHKAPGGVVAYTPQGEIGNAHFLRIWATSTLPHEQ